MPPLIQSSSPAAFKSNVRELMKSGKRPIKQALAISYRVQRGNRQKGRSVRPSRPRRRPGYQSGGLVKRPYPRQKVPFLNQPQNQYNQPHQGQPLVFHPGAAR
jgi:hypothetical protein